MSGIGDVSWFDGRTRLVDLVGSDVPVPTREYREGVVSEVKRAGGLLLADPTKPMGAEWGELLDA